MLDFCTIMLYLFQLASYKHKKKAAHKMFIHFVQYTTNLVKYLDEHIRNPSLIGLCQGT